MRERNEDGQYVETIDPESVLRAVREAYKVITTEDVADSLGIGQEAARQKLTKLEEQGEIHREDSVVYEE
jgi:predicted ArsR family transcriptional regulator